MNGLLPNRVTVMCTNQLKGNGHFEIISMNTNLFAHETNLEITKKYVAKNVLKILSKFLIL